MIPSKFTTGESFISFKYRNLHWWSKYGIISDSPTVRLKLWKAFLDRNNIKLSYYDNKIVGEVCCGLFGGIVSNMEINAKTIYLIDIFMDSFREMAKELHIKYPLNSKIIACAAENMLMMDDGIDFLIGYNSLDHGWDIKAALSECIRVSRECLLSFDCRVIYVPPIVKHPRISKYPKQTKSYRTDMDHFQEIDPKEISDWLKKHIDEKYPGSILRISVLNIKEFPTLDIYVKKG